MASLNCTPLTYVQIDFHSSRMPHTLPKGTLEAVVMVNFDLEKATILADRFYLVTLHQALDKAFKPHHITIQRHLDQLRQQQQNTLNFLDRR